MATQSWHEVSVPEGNIGHPGSECIYREKECRSSLSETNLRESFLSFLDIKCQQG